MDAAIVTVKGSEMTISQDDLRLSFEREGRYIQDGVYDLYSLNLRKDGNYAITVIPRT